MKLDRIRRFLELLRGTLDELGKPAGACQDADGGGAVGVDHGVGPHDVRRARAHAAGGTEDLHGHLNGDVEVSLPLVLDHHAGERLAWLPARRRAQAEDGLGELVQSELVHLAGQPHLGVGIESQAEEPLGRLAGPFEISVCDRQPKHSSSRRFIRVLSSGWTDSVVARARARSPSCSSSSARSSRKSDSGFDDSATLVISAIASSFSSSHHRMLASASLG